MANFFADIIEKMKVLPTMGEGSLGMQTTTPQVFKKPTEGIGQDFFADIKKVLPSKKTVEKIIFGEEPMKFEVGEGLTPKQLAKAEEVIRTPAGGSIGRLMTPMQVASIASAYRKQQIAEKQGKTPETKISTELGRLALEEQANIVIGFISPLGGGKGLPKKPLTPEAGKVYRGTMGTGELNNILSGKARYIEGEVGGMWANTPEDAIKYAKGFSQTTGMASLKPTGEGNYLLEGIKKPTGEIIPISAKNINTGEIINLQTTKGEPLAQEAGKIPTGLKERGFITSIKEKLPNLKVAGQYIPRTNDELSITVRDIIAKDAIAAEKRAMIEVSDEAVAIADQLLGSYSEKIAATSDELLKDSLSERAALLANEAARNLTEAGRTVQAASLLGKLTPEGQLKFAAKEIQKFNETIEAGKTGAFGLKKKIPELTGEQSKEILTEMKVIQEMADGTEKVMKFQKLQEKIKALIPTPLLKKIITVWKAGLLTGIKTSGLNIYANVSHFGTEVIKDIPVTMVDKVVSLFTGVRAKAFSLKGIFGGGKTGLGKGWQYLSTGFDERNIGTKLDYKKINFGKGLIAKGLQKYTDTIFRVLGSEDQPFYYAAKLRSMYEQAKVAAINKGLKGGEAQKFINELVQNPTDDIIKYASMDAETAVFQNPTSLGRAAKAIQKTFGGLGEIPLPFGMTPSAVATQIVNYSPLGLAKPITRLFKAARTGQFDQRLFSEEVGRVITGSGALALGILLYKKGLVNTTRPTGEKEQKLQELEGKQANTINMGGKWRTAITLGPVGNLLIIGAIYQEEFDKSGSPTKAMITTLARGWKSFTQQTFLTGVNNFLDALSDPQRSAQSVVGSTVASAIPTIIADIARATDTKERQTFAPTAQQEIFNKLQARIPGLRETLEPQISVLGEERIIQENPLEIMFDPTRPSMARTTLVITELRRLWDAGFKVSPTLLGDKSGYDALTPSQNTQLWKKSGEMLNDKLKLLIQKDEYKNLPDDQKAKIIESFVDKSKLYARVGMVMGLVEGLKGDVLMAKLAELKKSGLLTREVFNMWNEL